MTRAVGVLIAIATLAASGAALAQPKPGATQADALFDRAKKLADAGQMAAACPIFAESYKLDPTAVRSMLHDAASGIPSERRISGHFRDIRCDPGRVRFGREPLGTREGEGHAVSGTQSLAGSVFDLRCGDRASDPSFGSLDRLQRSLLARWDVWQDRACELSSNPDARASVLLGECDERVSGRGHAGG